MVWTVCTRTAAADLVRVAPMGVDTRHLLMLVIATAGEAPSCHLSNTSAFHPLLTALQGIGIAPRLSCGQPRWA